MRLLSISSNYVCINRADTIGRPVLASAAGYTVVLKLAEYSGFEAIICAMKVVKQVNALVCNSLIIPQLRYKTQEPSETSPLPSSLGPSEIKSGFNFRAIQFPHICSPLKSLRDVLKASVLSKETERFHLRILNVH